LFLLSTLRQGIKATHSKYFYIRIILL